MSFNCIFWTTVRYKLSFICSLLWQRGKSESFSSNTSDFRAKHVKPVELGCIYLALESTSKLSLNHGVLSVMIFGLMRSQVPSNIFFKSVIFKDGLWYSMALPEMTYNCSRILDISDFSCVFLSEPYSGNTEPWNCTGCPVVISRSCAYCS